MVQRHADTFEGAPVEPAPDESDCTDQQDPARSDLPDHRLGIVVPLATAELVSVIFRHEQGWADDLAVLKDQVLDHVAVDGEVRDS